MKERGYTHQVLVRLKQTDHGILRNGIWAYTNERLCKDDLITVQIVENECSDNIAPVNLPLDIAYEDDDIIVINKPFDMPAHPSAGNHDNTLANALMYYYGSQNKPFVYRCINRLDRDTTGLTIVAKHALAGGILATLSQSVPSTGHTTPSAVGVHLHACASVLRLQERMLPP